MNSELLSVYTETYVAEIATLTLSAISRFSRLSFSDRDPVRAIQEIDIDAVTSHCSALSSPDVAREISRVTNRRIRMVKTDYPDPVKWHFYLEDIDVPEFIIDPAALQFLRMSDFTFNSQSQFLGTMFIGFRSQLWSIIQNPDVSITHCSTRSDKETSFLRIWGVNGIVSGVRDPEVFYNQAYGIY